MLPSAGAMRGWTQAEITTDSSCGGGGGGDGELQKAGDGSFAVFES